MDPREWLFDKRVVRRNLDKGVLNLKAFKDYLKTLEDLSEEFEIVEMGPKEDEDEEADEEEDDEE
jgi:hypothetical protein